MSKLSDPQDGSVHWEVHSGQKKIKASKISLIPISKLNPHPDNRPLGTHEERIQQLKQLISHDGFDSSHPLVVRPYSKGYQIIEGEHRFRAAKQLGYLELPCVVRDLNDTEALIQLILGNIQTESKPLEVGINAFKAVQKEGFSLAEYARRLGVSETTIRRYVSASEVFQFIRAQLPEGVLVLDEVHKLEEIHRSAQSDWLWFHDLIVKKELSKNQVIEISQAIRPVKTEHSSIYKLFDFVKIRQEIAQALIQDNPVPAETYADLLKTLEESYQNLDGETTLYEYNVLNDTIEEESVNLKDWFIGNLEKLEQISKQPVLEAYKDTLKLKRSSTQEEAERTAAYFRDKKNEKEREEQARVEREMRTVQPGEWWQLGPHFLYCGEGNDPAFRDNLPGAFALAFCNPPAQFTQASPGWAMDWLTSRAQIVAVSPPLEQLQTFLQSTQMPYRWSMSAHLKLPDAGEGLGSWIYTALFSQHMIPSEVSDTWKVDRSDIQGNKTYDYLRHLIEAFSRENERILDVYSGIGAMFFAAEDTHRVCYGAQNNPDMCKQIIERWEDMSGERARKQLGLG